ncbi:type II secretion system F family protein [Jeongeupia chitinilytica]|uniref:General secretion pathway protein F n=1 Tax=Jeongeupia chitinilytica TaxID=1041641 RepID=A0ABQ3H0S2_9NEIS|nr:type II secretion system F family protein [Jeongeupia chitinilytica]GHD61734.1 type II secretion system protein [Jeongeupia chitinilytica]
MQFRYRAVDNDGRIHLGTMDAANIADLELRLKRLSLSLIRARPALGPHALTARRIGRRELVTFCFHLEQLSRAGVPLLDGLTDLRDSSEHPRFRLVIAQLIEDIEGGKLFSQALAMHPRVFNPLFVNLVLAGEASGTLPVVLARLAESLKWQDELAAQARKVLAYPVFVMVVVLAVIAFLMSYLVPQMVEFMRSMNQTLSLNTRLLIGLSRMVLDYGWLLMAVPILPALLLPAWARRNAVLAERLDILKLNAPFVGPTLKKLSLARFADQFGLLYAAGVPILDALAICEGGVGNRGIAAALVRVRGLIREGVGIAASFEREQLFPPLVLRMVRIGEQTGGIDTGMRNVAYFFHRDVRESVSRIQGLVEPAMTVVLGLLLLWVMSAVLGPIFDTVGRLR